MRLYNNTRDAARASGQSDAAAAAAAQTVKDMTIQDLSCLTGSNLNANAIPPACNGEDSNRKWRTGPPT